MTVASDYRDQAESALAAYVTLTPNMSSAAYLATLRDAGQGMAVDQSVRFASQFTVVTPKLSERNVGLRAEVRGDVMAGTIYDRLGGPNHGAAFEFRRQSKPDSRLLAEAPPGRPYPAPPSASAVDFQGRYEAMLSERIGQDNPQVKATLNCGTDACVFTMGQGVSETYDLLEPIRRSHFGQAKFALKYAKDRKDVAKEEAPYLSSLLDSDAGIHSCINLGYKKSRFPGADVPGLTILCKLDSSPWGKPVVLHMGSILANCGKAFCRYGFLPLFSRE